MAAAPMLAPLLRRGETSHVLVNERTGSVIASVLELAADSRSRRRGLLGRTRFPAGHALFIAPCSAIHTFGMQFAIDVLFVTRTGLVTGIHTDLGPRRLAMSILAYAAIELPAGTLASAPVAPGDRLSIRLPAGAASA